MTDDTSQDEHEPRRDPLVIVVDAEYVFALERRVLELERRPAPVAQLPDPVARAIAGALEDHDGRLGRHRDELEALKQHQNDLGELVARHLPAASPATGGGYL